MSPTFHALDELFFDIGHARRREERGQPVEGEMMSLLTVPALMWPGQRTIAGTR